MEAISNKLELALCYAVKQFTSLTGVCVWFTTLAQFSKLSSATFGIIHTWGHFSTLSVGVLSEKGLQNLAYALYI